MTEIEKQIMVALDKFDGDRELAAIAVGKTVRAIEMAISKCDELRWKYGGGAINPPNGSQTLHRNGDVPSVPQEDRNLMTAMIQEDAMLEDGLQRLGLKPEEVKRALGLSQFGKGHFVPSVQIISSSMTTICIQLGTQLGHVMERLDEVRGEMKLVKGAIARSTLVEEEKYLNEALIGMAEQIRRMSDSAHRSMVLQASIRFKLQGRTLPGEKQKKPGFSTEQPPTIDVPNE